jgi:23S rRNA (cytosine1962-C5)-methyltransferase
LITLPYGNKREDMSEIILHPGREYSVLKRHPWIFSGAIKSIHGNPATGDTVDVLSDGDEFLAHAAYNQNSNIAARIWTWDPNEEVGTQFFERRLIQAIERRRMLAPLIPSNAMRLVHGESDGIPGLILDKYADVLVIQFLTAGVERWRDELMDIIKGITNPQVIYERSDVDVRQLEGLQEKSGFLYGGKLDRPMEIIENGMKFYVDVMEGHKTGFYLDQRDNRLLSRHIASERKVLDCFSYTGGFAVNCLYGGAKNVKLIETSNLAIEAARRNIQINNLDETKVEFIEQDVFKYLRTLRDMGESFDLIILDPPKFAPTAAQAERASRGYKDINLMAFKLLTRGGYLLTFSCSGGVSEELFQKIVAGAALDAKVEAVILERLHQATDHPVGLYFPEGAYLKGFLIQKMG